MQNVHIGCKLICRATRPGRGREGSSTQTGRTKGNMDTQCWLGNVVGMGQATPNQGCCSQQESHCLHRELQRGLQAPCTGRISARGLFPHPHHSADTAIWLCTLHPPEKEYTHGWEGDQELLAIPVVGCDAQ